MKITRRRLCLGLGACAFTATLEGRLHATRAFAQPTRSPVLVAVMLRGGLDGLSVVVPYADSNYRGLRNRIRIGAPDEPGGALPLENKLGLGLHPHMAPLLPLYRSGRLAFVNAVGAPVPSRSHFEMQRLIELGVARDERLEEGFLNRALRQLSRDDQLLRGVSTSPSLPLLLRGQTPTASLGPLMELSRNGRWQARAALLQQLYRGGNAKLDQAAAHGLEAMHELASVATSSLDPVSRSYPKGHFARSLASIAQLIRHGPDIPVFYTEAGGWDTHAGQGAAQGGLGRRLQMLAQALAAFDADLGEDASRVVTICFTEFGRTVRENGSAGTDHGHGSVALVMGGPVNGGHVFGGAPVLAQSALYEGRDMQVTTDYRALFGELLSRHLQVNDLSAVFPEYEVSPSQVPGVLRA